MIRRPPRSTQSRSSAASDVYKRQDTGAPSPQAGPASASTPETAGPKASTPASAAASAPTSAAPKPAAAAAPAGAAQPQSKAWHSQSAEEVLAQPGSAATGLPELPPVKTTLEHSP